MTDHTESTADRGSGLGSRIVVAFLAVYFVLAFAAMAIVGTLTDSLGVRGVAFVVLHAAAAAVAYRAVVAPRIDSLGVAEITTQLETLAGGFGLFAVVKHVLLLLFGRAAAWLAGADRVLVWIVDTTYLNTSLLPDVAALGVIALTIHVTEQARRGSLTMQRT